MSKRFLVVVHALDTRPPAGWLCGSARTWDLAIVVGTVEPPRFDALEPSTIVLHRPGPKWPALGRLLTETRAAWSAYEHIAIIDDSLLAGPADIDRLFAVVAELRLPLSQPALDGDDPAAHPLARRHEGFGLRFTDIVDARAVVFDAALLTKALPGMALGDPTTFGTAWPQLLDDPARECAVIDGVSLRRADRAASPGASARQAEAFETRGLCLAGYDREGRLHSLMDADGEAFVERLSRDWQALGAEARAHLLASHRAARAAVPSAQPRPSPRDPEPDISVVMPTFNRADILARSLEHLARQTLPGSRFEIIVVDDGSSDHTASVLAAAPKGLRLTALRQANLGPAAARNRGIERARAPWVLFLNDDALPAPDTLQIHLDEHALRGPRDAVLGRFPMHPDFTPTTRPVGWCMDHTTLIFDYPRMQPGRGYGSGQFYTCNISLARDFLRRLGGFDEGFVRMGAEDIEFGVRVQQQGGRVFYRPDCVAHHAHRLDAEGLARMFEFRGRGGVHLFVAQPTLDRPHYADMPPDRIDTFLRAHAALLPSLSRLHAALARVDALPRAATGEAADVEADPAARIDVHRLWACEPERIERLVQALGRRVEDHADRAAHQAAPSLEAAARCVYPALLFLKGYHDTLGVMSSLELRPFLDRCARARSSLASSWSLHG